MAAPDVFSSFMGGFNETYGMVSKMKSEKEKNALTQASTLLSEVDSWQKLKADSNLMEEQARQIVNELDLGDDEGSRAALKAVYSKLKANQNSKDRFALVKKDLEESGTTSFRLNTIKKEEAPVTPVALGVDSQTEEAIPGIKNPDNAITPAKQNSIDTGLGKVIEEKDAPDNTEKGLKVSKFLKLFDKQGKIDARALEIAKTAIGGEDMLSGYMDYRKTGEIPTLAEFADLPDDVSIVAGYATPLGKGWSIKSLAKDVQTPEQKYALIQSLSGNPDNDEAVEYLTKQRNEQLKENRLAGLMDGTTTPAQITNAAEFDYLLKAGIYNTDGEANYEAFPNFKEWRKNKDRLVKSYADSVFGSTLNQVTSVTSAITALGSVDAQVAAGELTQVEGADLTNRITDIKGQLVSEDNRKALLNKKPSSDVDKQKMSVVGPKGNSYGIARYDVNTGEKTLNGKPLGDTINGVNYVLIEPDLVDKFSEKVTKIAPDFNTKRQGFTAFLNRGQKLRDLVTAHPDVLLTAGSTSADITSLTKNVDFFIDAALRGEAKGYSVDSTGFNKYLSDEKGTSLLSLLPKEITELGALQAQYVSLRIQSAYALAQALGQEGKGLSDTDLKLQLDSISGTTDPEAFMNMTSTIIANLYEGIENERKAFMGQLDGIGLPVSMIERQPQNNPDYLKNLVNDSGRELIETSLSFTSTQREAARSAEALSGTLDAAGNASAKPEGNAARLARIKANIAARKATKQ